MRPRCGLFILVLFSAQLFAADPISIEGGPVDTGYDVGSTAEFRATVKGIEGDPSRYAVFADIQYVGTTAVASEQMDREPSSGRAGELRYQANWQVPADAPTGLYSVAVSVEDRTTRQKVRTQKVRGFVVFKKLVRIARVDLDKTFYAPGETIQSEIVVENLTNHDLTGLRVEFSNANYPWISTFSGEKSLSGQVPINPALNLKVLRQDLTIPAHGRTTLPMMPSGKAAFLQGEQVAVLGAGGPARNFKVPPPETDQYTVAVWNAERSVVYDMVFSPQAIVRDPDRTLPKPYSVNFTHRYNSDIDFTKYRQFFKPGETATSDTGPNHNQLPASLLVFCPHEDDEHPWAGLIHLMVEAGRPVRVVFFTGGDVGACERYYANACGPNEAREFGRVRMEESSEALEHIGLKRDNLIFLGLPDGGSGAIWFDHIKVANPFLSIYLATDHAPYENAYRLNLPYARDAVIGALKQIIEDFHPAMIATPHPDERHVDHRTANWFAIKACQELLKEKHLDPSTVVLADQAYGAGGYKPAPYHFQKYVVYLSGEAAILKQEMGWIYQSQDGNIDEGMRKTFDELPREEMHYRITDWQEHEGWNE